MFFRHGLMDRTTLLAGPSNVGLADPGQHTALSLSLVTIVLGLLHVTVDTVVLMKVESTLSVDVCNAFVDVRTALKRESVHERRRSR